jgi:hypothetical protein
MEFMLVMSVIAFVIKCELVPLEQASLDNKAERGAVNRFLREI